MSANRYPGTCSGCGVHVAAGDGVLDGRAVFCTQPLGPTRYDIDGFAFIVDTVTCETGQRREANRKAKAEAVRAAVVADPGVVAERAARQARDAEQDAKWAARGMTRCDRCGGEGGSQSWPGFSCYKCEGHGAVTA